MNKPQETTGAHARLETIPDNYACTECGAENLSVLVDVTYHARYGDYQADLPFDEKGRPEDQPVRVFCDACETYFRISSDLVETLIRYATN